jgi:NADH-quinone oxidoreductase subunit L
VLSAAEDAALHGGPPPAWAAWLVLFGGLLTVLITAAYSTRAWLLAFRGPTRSTSATAHDPPAPMRTSLVMLAVPTVLLAALAFMPSVVAAMFSPGVGVASEPEGPPVHAGTAAVSLALVGVGALAALAEWQRLGGRDPAAALGRAAPVFADGFGVDRVYDLLFVRPATALSRLVVVGDHDVVHAYVRGTGRAVRALGGVPQAAQAGHVQAYIAAGLAFVVVLALAGAGAALW